MRFTETTKSSKDDLTNVYHFKASSIEWKIIINLLSKALRNMPREVQELQPTYNRMKGMCQELSKCVKD